jgi:hypothetical protein
VISILIIGFGLLLASGASLLVVYSKDGAQESLGGFVVLVALIIVIIGSLARVAGI